MKASKKTRRLARQLFRLCVVDNRVDAARVRLVAQHLAQSTRRGTLAVLADFQRLVRLDRARHTAVVESATSLTDGMRERLRADLARAYGPELTAAFVENARLIGGLRIRVGSEVYDDSVQARLAAIEARFQAGAPAAIREGPHG